eukprot:2367903-Amphidinium_carterae.1
MGPPSRREAFLPVSLLGSTGHMSAGALTFLHLLVRDLALKRLGSGCGLNQWSHALSSVRSEFATSLSHTLVRHEVAVLRGSAPLVGAASV